MVLWLRIVCTNVYVNKEMVIRKYAENNLKII